MSKKITSLLTMLLLLFVSTGAMAQAPSLENKKITIGTAVSSIEADTWYLVYNGSRIDEAGKFLSAGDSPDIGGYMTDMGEDKATCKLNVSNVTTGSLAINCAAYLVRFIDVSGGDESEVYQIQFATGNYLTGDLKTISNKYESGKFNFYTIDTLSITTVQAETSFTGKAANSHQPITRPSRLQTPTTVFGMPSRYLSQKFQTKRLPWANCKKSSSSMTPTTIRSPRELFPVSTTILLYRHSTMPLPTHTPMPALSL